MTDKLSRRRGEKKMKNKLIVKMLVHKIPLWFLGARFILKISSNNLRRNKEFYFIKMKYKTPHQRYYLLRELLITLMFMMFCPYYYYLSHNNNI